MLRSLWLLFVYIAFLALGISAPFVATLGYVWVDTFGPQDNSYIILNQLPVAMIMAVAAIGGYLVMDRRSPPKFTAESALMILMIVWVNLTMLWAVAPEAAWGKWDIAVKTLGFAAFVPLVIRSRVQIEAFVQTYVFSLAANIIPFGIKTLISGGGYGMNLGLVAGNSGLAEGGLLSTICLMAVPLALFLSKHSQLIPRFKMMPLAYWAIAGLAVVTALGTFERSAVIGLVVLGIYMWIRSRHKFGFGVVAAVAACLIIYKSSSAWDERISSMSNFEHESSAFIRLQVWKWTLNYTATNPFGGGFMAYLIDHIELPSVNGEAPTIQFGRAFHSIYFEMLGEQGYPGLLMFISIAAITFFKLHRLAKRVRGNPEMTWVADLSAALQSGLAVFLTAGAFVGIAFQPMFWYFIAMSISLNAYVWRVENQEAKPDLGWRRMVVQGTDEPTARSNNPDWRNRPTPAG